MTNELKDLNSRITSKGWPPSRRAAQAKRLKILKPWTRSTGPRSTEGKAISAMNAHKHGLRGTLYRDILSVFTEQRRFVRAVLARYRDTPAAPSPLFTAMNRALSCSFDPGRQLFI